VSNCAVGSLYVPSLAEAPEHSTIIAQHQKQMVQEQMHAWAAFFARATHQFTWVTLVRCCGTTWAL
jgi:hypothetical protein